MFMKQEENNALEDCISTGRRLMGSEKITDLEPHVLDQVRQVRIYTEQRHHPLPKPKSSGF